MEPTGLQQQYNSDIAVPSECPLGYRDIFGWFDAEKIYQQIFDFIPNDGWFCEVGVFLGKSTAFFQEICRKNPDKQVNHIVIDTFEGTKGEHERILEQLGKPLKEAFIENMRKCGFDLDKIFIKVGKSQEILLRDFPHHFFDAIYIDGDHSYEAFKLDLKLTRLKVKKGGIIAGHDIDIPSVWRVLREEVKNFEWDKLQRSFIFINK
jgi:hypothetical protein